MSVSENRGTPKWMVYNGKPDQNGSFGGTTIFRNTHIVVLIPCDSDRRDRLQSGVGATRGQQIADAIHEDGTNLNRVKRCHNPKDRMVNVPA